MPRKVRGKKGNNNCFFTLLSLSLSASFFNSYLPTWIKVATGLRRFLIIFTSWRSNWHGCWNQISFPPNSQPFKEINTGHQLHPQVCFILFFINIWIIHSSCGQNTVSIHRTYKPRERSHQSPLLHFSDSSLHVCWNWLDTPHTSAMSVPRLMLHVIPEDQQREIPHYWQNDFQAVHWNLTLRGRPP